LASGAIARRIRRRVGDDVLTQSKQRVGFLKEKENQKTFSLFWKGFVSCFFFLVPRFLKIIDRCSWLLLANELNRERVAYC
jgi:hypothetical protein